MRALLAVAMVLVSSVSLADDSTDQKTILLVKPDGSGALYQGGQKLADLLKAAGSESLPLPEPKPIDPNPVPKPPPPDPKVPDPCQPPLCIRFKNGTELIYVRPEFSLPSELDRNTLDKLQTQ